jgi:PAS domain S-box-containing protein
MDTGKLEKKANILIVDDIDVNLRLLVEIFKKLDVNLILAMSGQEALGKIKDEEIALALIDVQLPQMDGFELAAKIQNDSIYHKIPIIFITAYQKNEIEQERYYESGAVDFIQKPFRKNILLSKVNVFLELYRQKQQIREQTLNIEEKANNLKELNNLLNNRLTYENLRSRILKLAVTMDDIEDFLDSVLFVIGDALKICRLCIFKHNHETNTMDISHEWCNTGVDSLTEILKGVDCSSIPNWMNSLKKGQILNYSDVHDIPDEGFRNFFSPKHVRSILAIPLFVNDNYDGFIGFNDCSQNREWRKLEVEFLLSISKIIVMVTERKLIEKKLKQTQLLLKSSMESSKDIIIVSIDRNYRYLYFNEAHKLTIKNVYNKDVEIGMNIMDNLTTDKDRQEAVANFDLALSGKSHVTIETFGNIKGNTFENSYNPIWNDKNEIVGVTIFSHDITLRKLAEEELKDSLEQLHELSKHVEKVREEERVSIARELHDDLGQALTAVKIDLGIIRQGINDNEMKIRINKTEALVSNTIKTVQEITFQLRPKIIDDLGLEAGIEWYTTEFSERNGIEIKLNLDSDIKFSPDVSLVIFRIMQESLTNVSRHANATQIDIHLFKEGDSIKFVLRDNGIGISDSQLQSKTSFGIIGMRERAKSVGGIINISKTSNGGTSLTLRLPLQNSEN